MSTLPATAVGLGFRAELAGDLLSSPGTVDFVEVVAEACLGNPAVRREAIALSRVWPVVPHGVKLSLGSAEGIDVERARRLGTLARDVDAPVVTEHVAFVRAGGREIGHLTPVPLTRASTRVVARNVAVARRHLPDVPLLLENVAWTFRWPDPELDEASFYCELVERTGCDLLLDLGNLYANAINSGADPFAVLAGYPLEHVAMVHVAGGVTKDGFYFDTHAHAVPERVFELLGWLMERIGPVPIVLERDDGFPSFADLASEVARLRSVVTAGSTRRIEAPVPARPSPMNWPASSPRPEHFEQLAQAQADLAALLTEPEGPSAEAAQPFGELAVARARDVLRRKRVDEALPLLQRLLPSREALRPLAFDAVAAAPRVRFLGTVADAIRIATAATTDPRHARQARVDLLLLRSRFVGPSNDGSVRRRISPFVGRERLPGGHTIWVVKGPGTHAVARLFESRR